MSEKTHASRLFKLLYLALGLGAAYLGLRFALPWLLPFLLGFLTARLVQPAIRFLVKKLRFPRGLASALCCGLALAILAGLAWLILGRVVYELSAAAKKLPALLAQVPEAAGQVEDRIYKWVIAAPAETQEYLFAAIDSIVSKLSLLPEKLYEWVLSLLSALVNGAPGTVLFLVTYAVSVFLISGSYSRITAFLMAQVPERFQHGAKTMKQDMFSTMGRWLKTQLMLMGITFLELCLALGILHIRYFVVAALVISLVDALPVLGVGTVLAPWGIYSLIRGDYVLGVGLLITWAVVTLVREFVEPRLLGRQIGLHPVATLVAMYVGFRAAGVAGMVLSPLILITLKQLNDHGFIKLWKPETIGE